jgi:hypothetical protein
MERRWRGSYDCGDLNIAYSFEKEEAIKLKIILYPVLCTG